MQSGSQPSSSQPPNHPWINLLGSTIAVITLALPLVTIAQTPIPSQPAPPPPPIEGQPQKPTHSPVPSVADRPSR